LEQNTTEVFNYANMKRASKLDEFFVPGLSNGKMTRYAEFGT